ACASAPRDSSPLCLIFIGWAWNSVTLLADPHFNRTPQKTSILSCKSTKIHNEFHKIDFCPFLKTSFFYKIDCQIQAFILDSAVN
ncbi:MAG: hypothetical protein WBG62_03950, partial [Cyclobacteriaceae bacterium]